MPYAGGIPPEWVEEGRGLRRNAGLKQERGQVRGLLMKHEARTF